MKRRTFLKVTGATAVAVPLVDQLLASGAKAIDPETLSLYPNPEQLRVTACDMCGAQDPIFVRVVDGKAVATFGNKASEYSGQKICGKAHAGLEKVYHPNRVLRPLMRRGPGRYEPVSWDEAIDFMARRLIKIEQMHGENAVHVYMGLGSQTAVWKSFWKKTYGTVNLFGNDSVCDAGRRTACGITMGDTRPLPDLINTKVGVIFGADYLASTKYLWYVTQMIAALEGGARFYVIDPRFSETAARAVAFGGTWVPIRPGTDAALAMSMANVIFNDPKKYAPKVDPRLVRWSADKSWHDGPHGFGVDKFHESVKGMTPEKTEPITGVPAKLVRQIVGDLCDCEAPLVDGWTGITHQKNGTQAMRAVMCLAGLAMSIDRKGGLVRQRTASLQSAGCKPIPGASYHQRGNKQKLASACGMWGFVRSDVNPFVPEAMLDPRFADKEYEERRGSAPAKRPPYPVKAFITSTRNFANGNSGSALWRRGLQHMLDQPDTLVVDINMFVSEQGAHSHLILPEASFLERDDLIKPSSLWPTLHVRRKVIEPRGDSKTLVDMTRMLAGALSKLGYKGGGFPVDSVVPYKNYLEVMHAQVGGADSAMWKALDRNGVWSEEAKPTYRDGNYGWSKLGKFTRTFDFYCPALAGEKPPDAIVHPATKVEGKAKSTYESYSLPPKGKFSPLPKQIQTPYQGGDSKHPLRLVGCGRQQWNSASKTTHLLSSAEKEPENLMSMHPRDAEPRKIRDGDLVRVRGAAKGEVEVRIKLTQGIRPGCVHLANGFGQNRALESVARRRGANINELTDPGNIDPISGAEGLAEMLVQVEGLS